MAFLLVQHSSDECLLRDLLAPVSALPVVRAQNDMPIEAGHVYAVPRYAPLTIVNGRFRVCTPSSRPDHRSPIDDLLGSLALDQGENAAGVVLGGDGSDGTFGLTAIKENGGLACVAAGSGYQGMVRNGTAAGPVDFILPAEDIPARLEDYFWRKARAERSNATEHLFELRTLLRAATGHDFSGYRENTIARRVQRRMNVLAIDDARRFIELLHHDPREVRILLQDLLISVTNFFREPRAFAALARAVIPQVFDGKGPNDTVRVWVPGCATGEEAYSIAILLAEQTACMAYPPKVQLFASDIKEHAIEAARLGRYSASIAKDVMPIRLERYFTCEDGTYRIADQLRQACVFSVHDLLRDSPFSGLDLISCRNLLVYFSANLQDRVLELFHQALVPAGHLFLGAPENVPRCSHLFVAVDRPHRIFQRCDLLAGTMDAARALDRSPCVSARSDCNLKSG